MITGNRISVAVYGAALTGTIIRVNGYIAFVRMDHNGKERWFHRESLTVTA